MGLKLIAAGAVGGVTMLLLLLWDPVWGPVIFSWAMPVLLVALLDRESRK